MSNEFEATSIEAIKKTAQTFEAQCATQKTGCALQARFLNNVAVQYEKAKQQSKRVFVGQLQQVVKTESMQQPYNEPTDPNPAIGAQLNQNQNQMDQDMVPQRPAYPQTYTTTQGIAPTQDNFYTNTAGIGYETELSGWNFDNNDQWETMFANAGYRIYDGVFMPEDAMAAGLEG